MDCCFGPRHTHTHGLGWVVRDTIAICRFVSDGAQKVFFFWSLLLLLFVVVVVNFGFVVLIPFYSFFLRFSFFFLLLLFTHKMALHLLPHSREEESRARHHSIISTKCNSEVKQRCCCCCCCCLWARLDHVLYTCCTSPGPHFLPFSFSTFYPRPIKMTMKRNENRPPSTTTSVHIQQSVCLNACVCTNKERVGHLVQRFYFDSEGKRRELGFFFLLLFCPHLHGGTVMVSNAKRSPISRSHPSERAQE